MKTPGITEKFSMRFRLVPVFLIAVSLSPGIARAVCDDLARGFRNPGGSAPNGSLQAFANGAIPESFFSNPAKKGVESYLALAKGRISDQEFVLLKNAIEVDRLHPGMSVKEKLLLLRADHLAKDQLWKVAELKKVVDAAETKEEVRRGAAALSSKIEAQAKKGILGYYEHLEQTLDFCYLVSGQVRGSFDYQVVSKSGRMGLFAERNPMVSTRLYFPSHDAASTQSISRQLVFGVSLLGELGFGESMIADGARFRDAVEFLGHDMDHRIMMSSVEEELKDRAAIKARVDGTSAGKDQILARAIAEEQQSFSERVHLADAYARLEALAAALPQDDRDLVENGFFYITHEYHSGPGGDPRSPGSLNLIVRELRRLKVDPSLRKGVIDDMKKAYLNPDHTGTFFKNRSTITPERIG
ncbi:MAG: hypothetical protein EBX52_07705 [Proteobacteria bacterium]|nr:hypothetical protein [Pseudomonadota bacterium]